MNCQIRWKPCKPIIISNAKRVQKGWFGALVEAVAIEKVVLDESRLHFFLGNQLGHVLFSFFIVIKLFLRLGQFPTKPFDYLRGAFLYVAEFGFVFNFLGPSCELDGGNGFWVIAVFEGASRDDAGAAVSSQ